MLPIIFHLILFKILYIDPKGAKTRLVNIGSLPDNIGNLPDMTSTGHITLNINKINSANTISLPIETKINYAQFIYTLVCIFLVFKDYFTPRPDGEYPTDEN